MRRAASATVALLLAGAALVGLLLGPAALEGQSVTAAVLADSVRVGDVVPVAVRVSALPGHRVSLPPLLPVEGTDTENAASLQQQSQTLPDGSVVVTGIYSVTPWRPGEARLPELPVRVEGPDAQERLLMAELPTLPVQSVLPTDADLLDPMPPKDVLGRSYLRWPFLLLALALLALAGLGAWWLRRRQGTASAVVPAGDLPPRERALMSLRDARQAGLIEEGDWKEFYTRVSHALRDYLDALESAWGEDLTTTEVLSRVRELAGATVAGDLAALLRPADQVKFARRQPTAAEALAEWEAAERWVEEFRHPRHEEQVERAA